MRAIAIVSALLASSAVNAQQVTFKPHDINPASETVLEECLVEPALEDLPVGETVQFERLGYFCADSDSSPGQLVFNRTLGLKDTWAKFRA